MSYQHKDLASGRWKDMPLLERMAHIGEEVGRAISWRERGNASYSEKAIERALELIDLSLEHPLCPSHAKEIARMREVLVDYFYGENEFKSTDSAWRRYFSPFAYAARRST
jgi:hypothetical protein